MDVWRESDELIFFLELGRKRKETCEVLGWKLEPHEATKTIYKYVLPPPRRPLHTPMNSPPKDQRNQPVDPVELSRRLEELRYK